MTLMASFDLWSGAQGFAFTTTTATAAFGRTAMMSRISRHRKSAFRLAYSNNAAFDMEDAATPLSTNDLLLLQSLRRRQVRMPIMILESLLPDQVVTLRSSDPVFSRLLQFAALHCESRVAVVGLHPVTGNPLSYGVLAELESIAGSPSERESRAVRITALQRIHVSGDIVEHQRKGFFVADCEIMNDHSGHHNGNTNAKAPQLAARLTKLIRQWKDRVSTAGAIARESLPKSFSLDKDISPKDWTSLAFYAATLLQPVSINAASTTKTDDTSVVDIRPAMITAQTAGERLALAVTALQVRLDDHHSNP